MVGGRQCWLLPSGPTTDPSNPCMVAPKTASRISIIIFRVQSDALGLQRLSNLLRAPGEAVMNCGTCPGLLRIHKPFCLRRHVSAVIFPRRVGKTILIWNEVKSSLRAWGWHGLAQTKLCDTLQSQPTVPVASLPHLPFALKKGSYCLLRLLPNCCPWRL